MRECYCGQCEELLKKLENSKVLVAGLFECLELWANLDKSGGLQKRIQEHKARIIELGFADDEK